MKNKLTKSECSGTNVFLWICGLVLCVISASLDLTGWCIVGLLISITARLNDISTDICKTKEDYDPRSDA